MPGPLAGLRVVEMEGLGPCPLAGQFLSDLGAEVTLIVRRSGAPDPAVIVNRGKRSVALNLKTEAGLAAARRLIDRADILIEGFRPGVMERIGLAPETCHASNPGLIYGRMTGWGQDGPLAQTAGHDINYLGVTGILHAIGARSAPPPPPLNIGADYAGGTMFLLLGVLSALWERQKSGRGQVVDAAMIDGATALMSLFHQFLAQGFFTTTREDNMLDGGAPFYRSYECADGEYLSVGALEPQFFAELVRLAGLPEAHASDYMDKTTWAARHSAYAAVFATKTRDEWAAIFEGSDACAAPIMNWREAPSHPQMAARGVLRDVGGVIQAAPAPRFDRTPATDIANPPAPGGDTDAVLAGLGYDAKDIAAMRAEGAAG